MDTNPLAQFPASSPVVGRSVLPRLAIVSTYDELCGIAGYTRSLKEQLSAYFDVTVIELDQYLMRSPHAAVQQMASRHVKEIAAQLKHFDCVNIQLEHGTLGRSPKQILRRFTWLLEAAPALSITFHTIFPVEKMDWTTFWSKMARLNVVGAEKIWAGYKRRKLVTTHLYKKIRQEQQKKHVAVITHTKRDMRLLRDVYKMRNIYHHPLCYISPEQREATLASAGRDRFPLLRTLPADAKLIGTFGFLSSYKGFDTVIRALRHLPDDHHLLIFGGVHPQTIRKQVAIDDYVQKLLDEAYVGRSVIDDVLESKSANVSLSLEAGAREFLDEHPKSLANRVHFMGPLSDSKFFEAMAVCDSVVFAYLEVGQSSSGPIAQAIEMGCRVIASRTNTFLQYERYYPDTFEFFDIGNYLELASRLKADSPIDCMARTLRYNTQTNALLYWQATSRQAAGEAPGERSFEAVQERSEA